MMSNRLTKINYVFAKENGYIISFSKVRGIFKPDKFEPSYTLIEDDNTIEVIFYFEQYEDDLKELSLVRKIYDLFDQIPVELDNSEEIKVKPLIESKCEKIVGELVG